MAALPGMDHDHWEEPPSRPSVAVAVPAYNEADGLPGFLVEMDHALIPHVEGLRFVVVDDASTDDTVALLEALRPRLRAELEIITSCANRGHGPSLMTAYQRCILSSPDYVLQVDGDGQFLGADLRRLLVLLMDGAQTVSGVRRFRQDPWFRMIMTRLVRRYVGLGFSVHARDPNCPLRGYRTDLLAELLEQVPSTSCLIPNLYLTILAAKQGVPSVEVDVSHRVRRGTSALGTSWRQGARSPIPWRLARFSLSALLESVRFRSAVRGRAKSSTFGGLR